MDEKFVQCRIRTWNKSLWALADSAEEVTVPRGKECKESLNLTHLGSLVGRVHCIGKLHTCQKLSARHCLKLALWISPHTPGYYLLRCARGQVSSGSKSKRQREEAGLSRMQRKP